MKKFFSLSTVLFSILLFQVSYAAVDLDGDANGLIDVSKGGLNALPTADTQLLQATGEGTFGWAAVIDDTKGNGDAEFLWSADKIFDQLALKQTIGGDSITIKSTATGYTIGTTAPNEAYGGTVYVTGAATITVPAVVAGMNFKVVTIGDVAVSVDVNASDRMYLDGVALADGDKATNSSKSGDTLECDYQSTDGWYCWSSTVLGGHWTDGN